MGTIVVKKDGEEVARFENEKSDIKAVKYLHDHSSSSNHWAIMYEGWSYDMIENDGSVVTVDKDYLSRLDKDIKRKRDQDNVYLGKMKSIQEI